MAEADPTSLIGEREAGEPADEAKHFFLCKARQQLVDMRDLAVVFHHEDLGHEPLPAEDAERMLRNIRAIAPRDHQASR